MEKCSDGRREFLCDSLKLGAVASLSSWAGQAASMPVKRYARVQLVDEFFRPLKAGALQVNKAYLFNYPYQSTPVFLLNLGKPIVQGATLQTHRQENYQWEGGVGKTKSIVAFSAICAHQLAYPTRDLSFIHFREKPGDQGEHAQLIHCCAEHSQYDPSRGAKVVSGPANQPLAAVLLDYDTSTDGLFATAVAGGELFDAFFKKYEFKLAMEHGQRAKLPADGGAQVKLMTQVCRQVASC
jgi:arsenite oxidase small subunit